MAQRTFDIGLALAGTVSAGAYTAGVIDFLLEALEAWQAAKDKQEKDQREFVPDHAVSLRAVSGASGGAITAALLARCLAGSRFVPVTDPNNPPDKKVPDPRCAALPFDNPLYATWVRSIDIEHLLGARDLQSKSARVKSMLDSTVLQYIGDNALVSAGVRPARPPYIAEPLHLFFTTSNLRGVPYGLAFTGQIRNYEHMMTAYADHRHFTLQWGGAAPGGDDLALDAAAVGPSGNWETMLACALASGAFPVGLAPRLLSRPIAEYETRQWPVPQARPLRRCDDPNVSVPECDLPKQRALVCTDGVGLMAVPEKLQPIHPLWPTGIDRMTYRYEYWNVDGGLFNNQPLELARRVLTDGMGRNPRGGSEATCALIMIEPFPTTTDVTPSYDRSISLVDIVVKMFGALKDQARFKLEDLLLAQQEDVYSRFVVAPLYIDNAGQTTKPAIAAELLGGFGAFLSERFRHHDFQLGRRNCQQFLRRNFVLPKTNPLFGLAPGAPEPRWSIDFTVKDDPAKANADPTAYLPIIPLVKFTTKAADGTDVVIDTQKEVPLPRRPRAADVDLAALRKAIKNRIDAVAPRLIDEVPFFLARVGLKTLWRCVWLFGQRQQITDKIVSRIEGELDRLG